MWMNLEDYVKSSRTMYLGRFGRLCQELENNVSFKTKNETVIIS